MLHWQSLESIAQVDQILANSHEVPCLIFKHSTRCSISFIAKHRLEGNWDLDEKTVRPFYLDLVAHREVSNYVAEKLGVRHESPQVLLIRNGRCVYDASHLDVSVEGLKSHLAGYRGLVE